MTDKIKEKANLKLNGDLYDFDVHEGTIGPDVLDISKLYAQSGKFTYDPGFTSTANCKSTITYIDGEEGTLLYRGYPIDQLAEQGNYLETCYLLLNGELPNQDEYNKFEETINEYTLVNEQLNRFFTGLNNFFPIPSPILDQHSLIKSILKNNYNSFAYLNIPLHAHIGDLQLLLI